MKDRNDIPYSQEVLRKCIHLCSLSIPIVGSFLDRKAMLEILIPITLFTIIIDLLSHKIESVRNFMRRVFGKMLRKHENGKEILLNGASWVFLSAVLCISIFPKIIFITAFSILIISDVSAALYGRKFGTRKFLDKSLQGSSAFFISSIIVILVVGFLSGAPVTYYAFGILGGFVAAIVEAASKRLRVDDNLSIPLSVGAIMMIGSMISDAIGNSFINILR